MLATGPEVGPYRQNYVAGLAEDMAEIAARGDTVTVPAGTYPGCLLIREWSLLEAGTDRKWYARGVGLVRTIASDKDTEVLVSITRK